MLCQKIEAEHGRATAQGRFPRRGRSAGNRPIGKQRPPGPGPKEAHGLAPAGEVAERRRDRGPHLEGAAVAENRRSALARILTVMKAGAGPHACLALSGLPASSGLWASASSEAA